MSDKRPLISGAGREYGGTVAPPPPDDTQTPTTAAATEGEEARKKRGGGNGGKPRLQRHPSLEKVDETAEKLEPLPPPGPGGKASSGGGGLFGCQNLSSMFGVKSYLHHFYETHQYKDPDMYEDDEDFRYLLHPPRRRRRRCTSIWWKVFVWIGANFLVFGVVGVLVGYLVPQRPIIVGSISDNIEIIDRHAISFNFNLDVCKLVGLILFSIGGLTLTVALLFPSFLHQYCDDDRGRSEVNVGEFHVVAADTSQEKPPLSPIERSIPSYSTVTSVQPERNAEEAAALTRDGMVAYHD